jgi:Recombination endonuclease VII
MRRTYLLRRYGSSLEDLERLLHEQRGRCAICRRHWQECTPAKRTAHETIFLQHLHVDHDHGSGTVRGLLCNACNTAIGLFEEDVPRFLSAVEYLRNSVVHRTLAAESVLRDSSVKGR